MDTTPGKQRFYTYSYEELFVLANFEEKEVVGCAPARVAAAVGMPCLALQHLGVG